MNLNPINHNQKSSKQNNLDDILDKNTISIYKNMNSINNISNENSSLNKIKSNKKLILSKNKKINSDQKHIYERKINAPLLDLKNLKKNLKYKEDDITVPSSNRNFYISENDNDNENKEYLNDIHIYKNNNNNINNDNKKSYDFENSETYKTEGGFIKKENEIIISPEDLFKKIISINLSIKISNEELKLFLFNQIPKNETFISNINIIYPNKSQNNEFNYNLEIIRNNQIYYFAKIIKFFPQMKIKIFLSNNYNNINNNHYSQISNENIDFNSNSNLIYVGKIVSNFMRTNFVVYSGNKKDNYIKNLEINYSMNFLGLLGVREMKIDKYVNDRISFSLCNSKPEWDFQYNNYKMNFNGRVKQISKKNFILIEKLNKSNENKESKDKKSNIINDGNENKNILQCGKIDDKTYTLDFISPLSPFEAFCISITSLVTKITCE